MPVYNYKTSNGKIIEIFQRHDAEPLTKHPSTGEGIRRVYSAPTIIFKGTGFYTTDYKSSGASSEDSSQSS